MKVTITQILKGGLIFIFLLLVNFSFGAKYVIEATESSGNDVFIPATLSVKVGDTIIFEETGASPHTTTSSNVPSGAGTWDYTFTGMGDKFEYVVTTAGSYQYYCKFHATPTSGTMRGEFTATTSSGITKNELNREISIFPNPVAEKLFINRNGSSGILNLQITGMDGKVLKEIRINSANRQVAVDLDFLSTGIYFLRINSEGREASVVRFLKK